jgi:hypothetical protein
MSRPGSTSHFQGAIILDEGLEFTIFPTGTDDTGRIGYFGFSKNLRVGVSADESDGPRVSTADNVGNFFQPMGSITLPSTVQWAASGIRHNTGTHIQTDGWRWILQQGGQLLPVDPVGTSATVIAGAFLMFDLPDTGAVLSVDTDFTLTTQVNIIDTWGYKLNATGILTDNLMVTLNGTNIYNAPIRLIAPVAAGIGGRIQPRELLVPATATAGQVLRFTQTKANAGDNNAVRWLAKVV